MKVKLSKVFSIAVIFIAVFILSYVYAVPYVLDSIERYTNPYGVIERDPNSIETFTIDYATESFDGNWRWNVLQGVVDSYGNKDGVDYVRVTYIDSEGKDQFANVMIKVSPDVISKFEYYVKLDNADKKEFYDLHVNYVSFYESDINSADKTVLPTRMKLENFKNLFTKETLLIFRIASEMPNYVSRTDDYCLKKIGPDKCLYSDMLEKYAPDWTDLWKSQKVNEESILVPLNILSSFTEINEKTD